MRVSDRIMKAAAAEAAVLHGKTAVVGLSGGADSVCLTHVLRALGMNVVCAHVNHCLRGEEADGDEAFVKAFCEELQIKLFTLRADVSALAKLHGTSCEDEGRRVRYEFFESVPVDNKIIVTAHNKNDAAETILLHLIRGSGGLKGIPQREGIVRPLIGISRREIEAYCLENGLSYRTDSSNLTDEYTRNKLRLNVIPEIEKINPSFADALIRAAEVSGMEAELAEFEAEKIPIEEKNGRVYAEISKYKRAVLMRLIRRMYSLVYGSDKNLGYLAVAAAAELVEKGETGKCADLYDGIFLETEYGFFSIGREVKTSDFKYKLDGDTFIPEIGICVTRKVGKGDGYVIDADKIGEIFVRNRINGDRCTFRGHTKKLKDILIDLKIPKTQRARVAVLESENRCIGALGFGINKEYLPNENTVNFITVDWRKYDE